MSLVWGLPLGLLALVALLLPVLLHLDRRRTLQTLRFAALRWIGSTHPPRRSPRITEWLLLLLRLLLLACVALWLAQPLLRGEWRAPQRWLTVVPGVDAEAVRAASVGMDQVRWLTPGFPGIEHDPDRRNAPSASLLRELDAQLGSKDTLRVLLPERVGGLDAESIRLSRRVEWRIAHGSTGTVAAPTTPATQSPQLVLWQDGTDDEPLFWLQAAIASWSRLPEFTVAVQRPRRDQAWSSHADAVIVIGEMLPDAAQELLEQGSTVLHIRPTAPDTSAAADSTQWPPRPQRVGTGQLLQLRGPLQPARMPALHASTFPLQLHRALFGQLPAPTVALSEQVAPTQQQRTPFVPETPLRAWLAILIAVLFLLERWLASGRRLRGAA